MVACKSQVTHAGCAMSRSAGLRAAPRDDAGDIVRDAAGARRTRSVEADVQVLEAIQESVAAAAAAVGPSVVGLGRGWGRGSGVVVAPGRVLTNAHVLRGDEVGVSFADGRMEHGRLLAADVDMDVAVL